MTGAGNKIPKQGVVSSNLITRLICFKPQHFRRVQ